MVFIRDLSVVDPGFPRGGGTNPKGGAPTYYLANFSRKLHENEEILGQRGGTHPLHPPLDLPLQITQKVKLKDYNSLILNFYGGMILAMVSLILSLSTEDMTFPLGIFLDIFARGRKLLESNYPKISSLQCHELHWKNVVSHTEPEKIILLMGQSICSGMAVMLTTKAISLASPILVAVVLSLQVMCLLPPAYVVRGKVMFWHLSVCLSTLSRGGPSLSKGKIYWHQIWLDTCSDWKKIFFVDRPPPSKGKIFWP